MSRCRRRILVNGYCVIGYFIDSLTILSLEKIERMKLILTKAVVKENIGKSQYLVEDIFDKQIIQISLSGKQRMHYYDLKIGKEIYVVYSPHDSTKGALVTETEFKSDTYRLGGQRNLIDRRREIK